VSFFNQPASSAKSKLFYVLVSVIINALILINTVELGYNVIKGT
jgi:hypothetical protein